MVTNTLFQRVEELEAKLSAAQAERDKLTDKLDAARAEKRSAYLKVDKMASCLKLSKAEVKRLKHEYQLTLDNMHGVVGVSDDLRDEVERLKAMNTRLTQNESLALGQVNDLNQDLKMLRPKIELLVAIEQSARELEDRLQKLADMAVAGERNLGLGDHELSRRQIALRKALESVK